MGIISLKDAINLGLKSYFTGIPCVHGHVFARLVSNRSCLDCSKTRRKEWEEKNKDSVLKKAAQNSRNNRKNNKIAVNASRRLWASKNREKDNAYYAKWRANNKGHVNALNRKYQASKLQRTPKWLTEIDFERITNEYKLAEILRKVTNQNWHVDHIIPLQGKTVSGLHVPSNLRVVIAAENVKKGNRFEVNHA